MEGRLWRPRKRGEEKEVEVGEREPQLALASGLSG
jgi:hypothetical protein